MGTREKTFAKGDHVFLETFKPEYRNIHILFA
jgi:hypothetical protein